MTSVILIPDWIYNIVIQFVFENDMDLDWNTKINLLSVGSGYPGKARLIALT